MKNILFISYEFPPIKRGGVFRSLSFVRHLPKFGYKPWVLVRSHKEWQKEEGNLDFEFARDVVNNSEIIEIKSSLVHLNKKNRISAFLSVFFNPEGRERKNWKRNFNKEIKVLLPKVKPDLIFITAPPFSIIDLAIDIKQSYKIPLVLDMRDAWSNWILTPYLTKIHYKRVFYLERKALKSSDKVIVTSKQTIFDFQRIHPQVDKLKFHYLPNGFEGDLASFKQINKDQNTFKIGYVGSFYYSPENRNNMMMPSHKRVGLKKFMYLPNKQDWIYRSPYFFFNCLSKFLDEHPKYKSKVKVDFVGKKEIWLDDMICDFGLESIVTFRGFMSHDESVAFQRDCDALLITSSKLVDGRDYSIAGKTFEYFKVQIPILAFVCEGSQLDLIRDSGCGIIINPDKTDESISLLKQFIDGEISFRPNKNFIIKHKREFLTKKLSKIFDELIDKQNDII